MSGCRCGRGAVAALALRGLVGHCCPGAPPPPRRCGALAPLLPRHRGVADVGGSDADRGEAEPFTAKRSGTG